MSEDHQPDARPTTDGGSQPAGPDVAVAVVDAETPGNVGTVARAMKNFGCSELLLVDPPALPADGEAYGFAGRAREDVLPNAREVSFAHLIEQYHTIGTTAVPNEDETSHVRYPVRTPAELADSLTAVDADSCVVFGRERVGLTNAELGRLDEVCSVPAAPAYPVLNLGQAATIVLYELRTVTLAATQHPDERHQRADERLIEGLHEEFNTFLAAVDHPPEKRAKTRRLWRRVVGRAHPTGREATTLRGLFRRGVQRLADADQDEDEDS
jgi:tRNA (cytidine32/uridine32-2'-O)-methyltransferase